MAWPSSSRFLLCDSRRAIPIWRRQRPRGSTSSRRCEPAIGRRRKPAWWRALQEFGPTLLQLADDDLRKMAESFGTFRVTGRTRDFQEAVVALKEGTSGFIMFQLVDGNWRISEL